MFSSLELRKRILKVARYIINNFVALRKTRGDILTPVQFRSAVEMIQGIVRSGTYDTFRDDYKLFLAHLLDFNDPHHDADPKFFDEIVMRIYAIYLQMTPQPLAYAAFSTEVAGTPKLFELMRRIMLNRLLYNQIANPDGSVPETVTVYLGEDWNISDIPVPVLTVSLPAGILNETQFIQTGWKGNTTPTPIIFNANTLSFQKATLPIIFETSATVQYLSSDDTGSGYPVILQSASNDLSLRLDVSGAPDVPIKLFSLLNANTNLSVWMNSVKNVQLVVNGTPVAGDTVYADDGKITVILRGDGSARLRGRHTNVITQVDYPSLFSGPITPFTSALLSVPLSPPTGGSFGLRNCVIYRGDLDGTWSL
jgi:hypothetical protein